MTYENVLKAVECFGTIEDVQEKLKIDRAKAIYLLHRLRKLGYVKTSYLPNKKRIYLISRLNKQNRISYLESFNNDMPNAALRINSEEDYFVHGGKIKSEDKIVYALKKGTIRFVISSLYLFRKIEDWSYLYRVAKKEGLSRQVSALYDVSRMFIKKVRKMPKRFIRLTTPKKKDKYLFVVKGFSSDDFHDIEKKWKVYIPLNLADLEEYKLLS